ncbi:MAG TPA: DNA-3-methyladenine glycosylase 2 family protein [Acidimicrobiia bacterium]|nr:DNA-3-methyladenine glycosylase 2 family protein [Acidimicrobiia bacterium]
MAGTATSTSTRVLQLREPLHLGQTFGPVAHTLGWLTSRVRGDTWWHAMNTAAGPVTLLVEVDRDRAEATLRTWGPAHEWAAARIDALIGAAEPQRFGHPVLDGLAHSMPGLRVGALGAFGDLAAATIIGQRVTTVEARRQWRTIVRRFGVRAPGPVDLMLPPDARMLASLTDWEWRRAGVEGQRADTIRRCAREAPTLDRAETLDALTARLRTIRGIGRWTAAHITHFGAADPDAVPVGDWHLKHHVTYALAGERRGTDVRMLELLEPFRPNRARAWRLLMAGAPGPPRRAPRARIVGLLAAEARR